MPVDPKDAAKQKEAVKKIQEKLKSMKANLAKMKTDITAADKSAAEIEKA